jgi:hypothetical protein
MRQTFLLFCSSATSNETHDLMALEPRESSYKNCRSASHNPFHSPFQGKLFLKSIFLSFQQS